MIEQTDKQEMLSRWRLILGRFAQENIGLSEKYAETDHCLSYLYNNEYDEDRGIRGSKSPSVLSVPQWLGEIKKIFPEKTVEILQKDALDRYGLEELITDPDVLRSLEPDVDLLIRLVSFKNIIPSRLRSQADDIIRHVADEIKKKLETKVYKCFHGQRSGLTQTYYKVFRNFDFRKTIEMNLKNYSREYRTIIAKNLYFRNTVKRRNPWDIIILVDESGSMARSAVYSAVMAGIFTKLPVINTKLIVFDTSIVDLSDYTDDTAQMIMKMQLGGGTDIYKALCYGESLIKNPSKTIVILITDLYDSNDIRLTYRKCRDIISAGSRLFVLPALDYCSEPVYNRSAAKYIAGLGADVAAITPEELSQWIGKII
ncbi:MAG: VWA domain-containing protein [Oscillospiraceae bacterium]|nr:VWA domain-containing protein [Oscillospiraceae bacterium]